jgi:hypothetical protein
VACGWIIVLIASVAQAQEAPPLPAPTATPTTPAAPPARSAAQTPQEREIEKALEKDRAARARQPTGTAGGVAAASPGGTGGRLLGGSTTSIGRFFQTFNPDMSVILDVTPGWYSNDDGTVKSGDDPGGTGFNVQELELAFQAVVDPYFRADVFLTIPNLEGIEVEEAFLTTTGLPGNLQLRVGIFRADIGRQNTQHLHMQDFSRRPAINPYFLGIDGLRAPGLEINWLVPHLPFYLVLSASAFSVAPAEPDQVLQTFGGGKRWDFTYLGTLRAFFPLAEQHSLYVGLSYAHGKASQATTNNPSLPLGAVGTPIPTAFDGVDDHLYGGWFYYKWKPVNVARTWSSVAWQTEYFLRHIPDAPAAAGVASQVEGGLYSQVVVQVARRWYLGARGQLTGIPSGDNVPRQYGAAADVTWGLSEFSRIRLYGEVWIPSGAALKNHGAAFLQFEAAIGAHGAHPF